MLDFSVTFIFTLINIFFLFIILRRILFKPVTNFMESRVKAINDTIENAEKQKVEAKDLLRSYEERIKNVETEAETIIRSAREEAQRQADLILKDGKTKANDIITNAHSQVDAEYRAAMASFQSEAAAMVVTAAGRLLKKELNEQDSLKYAELMLQDIGKK